jgi:hypothetical protein
MANTLYDLGTMTSAEAWRAIRNFRAEPTDAAQQQLTKYANRKREFHMGLEQAQQQFAAAAVVGYESRALNLFYGLSQAGRAIAAASPLLGGTTGENWQASGHGLKFDVSLPLSLAAQPIRLEVSSKDLFSRVSHAVGSPLGFQEAPMGALWSQSLDYAYLFRDDYDYPRPISDVSVYDPDSLQYPIEVEIDVPGPGGGDLTDLAFVRSRLAPYPAVRDLPVAMDGVGLVKQGHSAGRVYVVVHDRSGLQGERESSISIAGASEYRRSSVILPAPNGADRPLRPIMAWWMSLYGFSMLARYAPSVWMQSLDLSRSPLASRIEFLLDAAIDAVPELIASEVAEL